MISAPRRRRTAAVVLAVALVLSACTRPTDPTAGQLALERSLTAYATAGLLNGRLLASRSATATLEAWCREHGLADPPTVVATRVNQNEKPPTEQQRAELQVGPDEPVRYRSVLLSCGERQLSHAENWYVPSRLTPEMNHALDTTNTPFGKVVAPLQPTRTTQDMRQLWEVLPDGWESRPAAELRDWAARHQDVIRYVEDREMFRHVAVLSRRGDNLPIAQVHETYVMGGLLFHAEAR